jgi:dTDP-glucose 4,6-dehydratase
MILITGAAGFIGGNFVHRWFARGDEPAVALDKLTYAGNAATIAPFLQPNVCTLVQGDTAD